MCIRDSPVVTPFRHRPLARAWTIARLGRTAVNQKPAGPKQPSRADKAEKLLQQTPINSKWGVDKNQTVGTARPGNATRQSCHYNAPGHGKPGTLEVLDNRISGRAMLLDEIRVRGAPAQCLYAE